MSSAADFLLPPLLPPPPPLTATGATASLSSSSPSPSSSFSQKLGSVGLGYAIAIAFGFLVFLSTVLLASYMCCRSAAARRRRRLDAEADFHDRNNSNETSMYLPRIIFVAEDENDDVSSSENVVVGLDLAVINSYPKFQFSKRVGIGTFGGDGTVCAICLCEYKDSEMLRLLPDCKHYFHVTCVDAWLKLNASCPVCRNSPLPTPLSTPLYEVVPLSQYSDGRRR